MNEVYDKLHFFHPGDKLIHNIEVIDAKGHTPGMCSFLFQNQAIFIGDLIHHLETQIKNPEKELIIDYEPKVAVESRLRLLNIISKNGWICLGSHLFPIGICKIKGDLTCYEYMTQK
jgi:glyoxylase-like metal-dependent hydrolase (beta-lactamase superfamily II)